MTPLANAVRFSSRQTGIQSKGINLTIGHADRIPVTDWTHSEIADDTPWPTHKFVPQIQGVDGYREVISLDDGFQLVKSDISFEQDAEFEVALDSLLKFQFRFEGSGVLQFNGHDDIKMHGFSGGVLLHPDGIEKLECFKSGEHERAITLLVSPDYLRKHVTVSNSDLPSPLTFYLDASVDDVFSSQLPLTPEIVSAAQALYNPSINPNFAPLYRQARAQELLIYCLDLLSGSNGEAPINLKSRDIKCINNARAILESDIESPPTIRDLAHLVGINESKLMYGFKKLYNQTVNDYLRTLRMSKAKELLSTTDLSITQIAFEVGYEFSSNFTTAFKRHFSVTPSSIRKQRVDL